MHNYTDSNIDGNDIYNYWDNGGVNSQNSDGQNFVYGRMGITRNNNYTDRNSFDNNYIHPNFVICQGNFVGQAPTGGIANSNGFIDQSTIVGPTNNDSNNNSNGIVNQNLTNAIGISYQNANNNFIGQNNYFNHSQNLINDKDQQLIHIISLLQSIQNSVNQLLGGNHNR